jgi:hypothetical protein
MEKADTMTISFVGKNGRLIRIHAFVVSFFFSLLLLCLGRSLAPSGIIPPRRTQYLCLKIAQDARFPTPPHLVTR